jgi:nickel transport protein
MRQHLAASMKILFWFALILLLPAQNTFAHRVNVFAWVEGDTVFVESKFAAGRKVNGGKIIVTDSKGVELLTGKTNDQGEFSFKIPQKTELKIILEAGMGHRAEWTIPVSEMESVSTAADAPATKTPTARESAAHGDQRSDEPAAASLPAPPAGPSPAEIEAAVAKVLDQKLKPLYKMMAESNQKGPTIRDIFGGIGYILGLMGVAAYFRYRRENSRRQ